MIGFLNAIPLLKTIKFLSLFIVLIMGLYVSSLYQSAGKLEAAASAERSYSDQIRQLLELRYAAAQVQQFLTDAALTGNSNATGEASDFHQSALKTLGSFELLPEQEPMASQLKLMLIKQFELGGSMVRAYNSGNKAEGDQQMARFDDASGELSRQTSKAVESIETKFQASKAENTAITQSMTHSQIVLMIVIMALVLGALSLIYWKVSSSTQRLYQGFQNLNSGDQDLSKRLPEVGKGRLTDVAREFNAFVSEIDRLTSVVMAVSKQSIKGMQALKASAIETYMGMEEVHSNADQLATATDEMAATVHEIAKNTETARSQAIVADQAAAKGMTVVQQTIELIRGMAATITNSANAVNELEQNSSQIGDIVDVIRSISEQTNLLALNAAIEAARAGEAGRGFAVVADEVRSLAKRTQDSTAQIQAMIEKLQSGTQTAVKNMRQTAEASESAVEHAMLAGTSLQSIQQTVAEMADMNTQVATASEEQTAVANEISRNVTTIADIAQTVLKVAQTNKLQASMSMVSAEEISLLMGQFIVTHNTEAIAANTIATWNDGFLVGIEKIDAQHRNMFDLMNGIYEQYRHNSGASAIERTVDALVGVALKHLVDEEDYMEKAGYSDLQNHRKVHEKLKVDLTKLVQAYKSNLAEDDLFNLIMFLKSWLMEHIYKVDRRYSRELLAAGIR
jgi:hemerythrin-like metal-binding protein